MSTRTFTPREHRLISFLIRQTCSHLEPHNERRTIAFLDRTFTGELICPSDDRRMGTYAIGTPEWRIACNAGYYGQTPLNESLDVTFEGDEAVMQNDFMILRLFERTPNPRVPV